MSDDEIIKATKKMRLNYQRITLESKIDRLENDVVEAKTPEVAELAMIKLKFFREKLEALEKKSSSEP